MANLPLTGNGISSSYQGLLKTSDNTAVGATEKPVVDGLANAIPMSVGTAGVSFTGGLDVSSATVTGLNGLAPAGGTTGQVLQKIDGTDYNYQWATAGGGAAGLVSGTGTDSMQSDASLTTLAANASGACSIALGNNARANATTSIAIGCGWAFATDAISIGGGSVYRDGAIHIGNSGKGDGLNGIAIGSGAIADGGSVGGDIAIGQNSCSKAASAISIGANSDAWGIKSIAIGDTSCASTICSIAIGPNACSTSEYGIAIGDSAIAVNNEDIAIGRNATNEASNKGGVSIGSNTCTDDGAVALGRNAKATGIHAIAIGGQCNLFSTTGAANSTSTASIAIGTGATASAARSVALGSLITAAKIDTVSVCQLETIGNGCGITMHSPNGTEYVLTVSDAGALVIT